MRRAIRVNSSCYRTKFNMLKLPLEENQLAIHNEQTVKTINISIMV